MGVGEDNGPIAAGADDAGAVGGVGGSSDAGAAGAAGASAVGAVAGAAAAGAAGRPTGTSPTAAPSSPVPDAPLATAAFAEGDMGIPSATPRFPLGRPELVCRWRLSGGHLPLSGRHLRALRQRDILGAHISAPLVAWAQEHIDWTLERGSARYPNGVLMLTVDAEGRAAMAVGPYESLGSTTVRALARRARLAQTEAARTRVAPETLWVVRDGVLLWMDEQANVASGSATFVRDLARALGMRLARMDEGPQFAKLREMRREKAFLVSDEHGVVVPSDCWSQEAQRLCESYNRLLDDSLLRKRRRQGRV